MGHVSEQVQIFQHGNTYTRETFPLLDYIIRCSIKNQTASTASSSHSDPQVTSSSNYKETAAILFVISAVIALIARNHFVVHRNRTNTSRP